MRLKKYYDALMKHEWDPRYEDPIKRTQHRNRYCDLAALQQKSPKHKKMFEDFIRYNTVLIRNPRLKPKRPL